MSFNGPLSGIRFSGLASGIDVESIVSQLIQIESVGITRLQAQQAQLQSKQTVYSQFRSKLTSLNGTLSKLNFAPTYSPVSAKTSDDEVVGVSATSSAASGNYSIQVNALAAAHKSTSVAQANATEALGLSGDFIVNGKGVTVGATDSLNDVASKINSANAGVNASVLNGGDGNTFLVITSNKTGAANEVQLSDLNGSVLSSLGVVSGGTSVRDESAGVNTARSYGFSADTTVLQDVFGVAKSGNVTIGAGASVVNIDFATDSLQAIAAKINAAGEPGVTATVKTEKVDGKTVHKLELSGADIPGTITDTDGLLESLGVLQRDFSNELVAAQDSEVVIDGLNIKKPTNSISSVIQGVTLNLEKVGTATVTLNRDTKAVKDSIKEIQSSFNDVIDYIRTNSTFDDETFASGPLFGDQTASQVESTLNELLFSKLGTGAYENFTDLGFGLDAEGKLTLDESKLTTALEDDLDGVKNLLMATGSSTNSSLKFVSSGNKTVASTGAGYAVDITQAATQTSTVAGTAKTLANVSGEVLTFSGKLFGSSTIDLSLDAGSSLADIIDKINSDTRLKDYVVASDDGGVLKVDSKRYGAAGVFSLVSNLAAANDTSGIGTTGGTTVDGLDVQGTINGEETTGTGQFLLGKEGNANTAGLQIQYTGSATGVIGNFVFNRGVASLMSYRLNSFTDSVDGLLTATDKTLTDQITDIDDRITAIQEQMGIREQTLRLKFGAMEQAIAQLNAQSGQLSAMLSSQSR